VKRARQPVKLNLGHLGPGLGILDPSLAQTGVVKWHGHHEKQAGA